MTFQQFETRIKQQNLFDRYWFTGVSGSMIIFGCVLLFLIMTKPESFKRTAPLHYGGFVFLCALGCYVLYKLPNRFKIISIQNQRNSEQNQEVVKEAMLSFGAPEKKSANNYRLYNYSKGFWSISYDIHILSEENKISFSIQGQGSSRGGFLDFGSTEKLRKSVRAEIEMLSYSYRFPD